MARPDRRRTAPVDWGVVRARLARTIAATESSFTPAPDQVRRIMDERARALARRPEPERRGDQLFEVLVFGLANERYAIETSYVRKLLRLNELTPVPGTPEFLRGIVNLHGEMLAVIDLRILCGLPIRGLTDLSRLIVVGAEHAEFGILADELHEVVSIPIEDLLALPAGAGPAQPYLKGVTQEALILLDGAALLEDGRLVVDQREEPLPNPGAID